MIFPKPIFIPYTARLDDYINETKYRTVDEILEFFTTDFQTDASLTLCDIGYLMKAKKDKSLNLVITKGNLDSFQVYDPEEELEEDHKIIFGSRRYTDIVCYRYNGKERVLQDLIQFDEHFGHIHNSVEGYNVFFNTGLTTATSDFVLKTKRNLRESKKSVKKFNL